MALDTASCAEVASLAAAVQIATPMLRSACDGSLVFPLRSEDLTPLNEMLEDIYRALVVLGYPN